MYLPPNAIAGHFQSSDIIPTTQRGGRTCSKPGNDEHYVTLVAVLHKMWHISSADSATIQKNSIS